VSVSVKIGAYLPSHKNMIKHSLAAKLRGKWGGELQVLTVEEHCDCLFEFVVVWHLSQHSCKTFLDNFVPDKLLLHLRNHVSETQLE
jgi:hypothetical protein